MHDLETLKRINDGTIKINRSLEFSPPERARAEDTNPKREERDELHPPLLICPVCDRAVPEDELKGDACLDCWGYERDHDGKLWVAK